MSKPSMNKYLASKEKTKEEERKYFISCFFVSRPKMKKTSLIGSLYLHLQVSAVRIFLTPFVQIIGGIANSRSWFLVLHLVHDVKRAGSVFKDTYDPKFNNDERQGVVNHMCGLIFIMSAV